MAPRVRVSPDRRRARATTSRWGALLHADAPAAAGRLAVAVWLPRDASPVLTRPVDVAAEHGYPVAPLPAPDDGPFAFGVEATMRAILSQAGWTGVSSTPHTVALHVGGPGCSAEEATHIVMVAGMVGRLVQDAPAAAAADAAADAERRRALGQDGFDEVWEGEYHVALMAHSRHGHVENQLARLLGPSAYAAGLRGSGPLNVGAPDDDRVADLAYLRGTALMVFHPTVAIAVEVVSPATRPAASWPSTSAAAPRSS